MTERRYHRFSHYPIHKRIQQLTFKHKLAKRLSRHIEAHVYRQYGNSIDEEQLTPMRQWRTNCAGDPKSLKNLLSYNFWQVQVHFYGQTIVHRLVHSRKILINEKYSQIDDL